MLRHYAQLLRRYGRIMAAIVAATTLFALAVSALKLSISPVYTAAASVAVIPTEAEYTFGRDSTMGPRSTARALTATYIEYLKSRPVVEAAFETISSKMKGGSSSDGWIASTIKSASATINKTYRILDSGIYVPADPRERALQELMDAITLETVADSYILRVAVSLPDPKTAAAAANALADAYVQRVSEQLATSVGQIGGFLREQIALRESEMSALRDREERLKAGVGASSLDEERNSLVRSRELERQKLLDAQVELDAAEAQAAMLKSQDLAVSGRSLTELNEARAIADARRDSAKRTVELRDKTIQSLTATLDTLKQKEEPLLSVQRRLQVVQDDLAQLHARALSTDLSQSSAMTQVRVIDPAVVPVYPSSPRVVYNTALGLVTGILVSLIFLVLVDAVSPAVKTTTDLARVAGFRSVGTLSSRLAPRSPLSRRRNVSRAEKLRRVGSLRAELERGLAMVSAFDAPSIQVTGFVGAAPLAHAAALIGAALASRGRQVVCSVPDSVPKPEDMSEIAGDHLRIVGSRPEGVPHQAIRIDCLPPVSAELSFAKAADRSPALICVVPTGQVPEQDVKDFLDRALEAGLTGVSFVLMES